MSKVIDVLLLLALPASGKSEVRRYLADLDPELCRDELHLGPTVQLGDYSYVHMMRRVSQVLRSLGHDGVFFDSDDLPMKETRDWNMVTELINQDFDDVVSGRMVTPASATAWLLDRFDRAREKFGLAPALGRLPAEHREELVLALEAETQDLVALKNAGIPRSLAGSTVVIEMARGGPDGSVPPLPEPYGYRHMLQTLSDEILTRASILYVWVTPEESRRKTAERAWVGHEGDQSILHHGVPMAVLLGDYGMDDMEYLLETSCRPDAIRVTTRGRTHMIPVARFDNRVDKTSFLRENRDAWPEASVRTLHEGLAGALARLVAAGAPLRD